MSSPEKITWLDGQEHFCPCNGKCHTEANPCSFTCATHHHLVKIEEEVKIEEQSLNEMIQDAITAKVKASKGDKFCGYLTSKEFIAVNKK